MLPLVRLIRRRYPEQAGPILATLAVLSSALLLLGMGILVD